MISLKWFKAQTVLIQLYRNRVVIRNIDLGITIDRTCSGKFSNPRMVLADFRVAEEFTRSLLREMSQKRFAPPMKVLVQPMELVDGGISPVEQRSFNDFAQHLGAKYVFLHLTQEPLSDQRVLELTRGKS